MTVDSPVTQRAVHLGDQWAVMEVNSATVNQHRPAAIQPDNVDHANTTVSEFSRHVVHWYVATTAAVNSEIGTERFNSASSAEIWWSPYRLHACRHLMDNPVDPNCPRCDQAPQTLEHWLDYPGTLQARLEMYYWTEALPLPRLYRLKTTLLTFPGKSVHRTGKT